jgi:hypothetical protein
MLCQANFGHISEVSRTTLEARVVINSLITVIWMWTTRWTSRVRPRLLCAPTSSRCMCPLWAEA